MPPVSAANDHTASLHALADPASAHPATRAAVCHTHALALLSLEHPDIADAVFEHHATVRSPLRIERKLALLPQAAHAAACRVAFAATPDHLDADSDRHAAFTRACSRFCPTSAACTR